MSRRLAMAACIVLAIGLLPLAGRAEEPDPSDIVRTVRVLFAMQDAVAMGNAAGLAGQRSILAALRSADDPLPAGTVPETAVAHAITAYVLSGGEPNRAEAYAGLQGLMPREVHMLRGAAAFMRGDPETARSELAGVDPLELPPAYGGRIALTRAMLADPSTEERLRFLTMAIALMPGTLVEEAALRRLAQTHGDAGDVSAFWKRTGRYVRRFRTSLYAPDFVNSIAGYAIGFHLAGHPVGLEDLDLALATFSAAHRRRLYLHMARQATARRAGELARFAGRRLVRLAQPGSLEEQQGTLYSWAHAIAGPEQARAWQYLRGIDPERLPADDREILITALDLIAQIEAEPVSPVPLAAGEADTPDDISRIVSRVTTLLDETRSLAGNP